MTEEGKAAVVAEFKKRLEGATPTELGLHRHMQVLAAARARGERPQGKDPTWTSATDDERDFCRLASLARSFAPDLAAQLVVH